MTIPAAGGGISICMPKQETRAVVCSLMGLVIGGRRADASNTPVTG